MKNQNKSRIFFNKNKGVNSYVNSRLKHHVIYLLAPVSEPVNPIDALFLHYIFSGADTPINVNAFFNVI